MQLGSKAEIALTDNWSKLSGHYVVIKYNNVIAIEQRHAEWACSMATAPVGESLNERHLIDPRASMKLWLVAYERGSCGTQRI